MIASGIPAGEVMIQGCARGSRRAVRVHGGTVREALDSIVGADSKYRWELNDGVVDLLPVEGLPSLLAVRIETFDSKDATDITSAGTFLFALPEIQDAAAKLGLTHNVSGTGLGYVLPGQTQPQEALKIRLQSVTVVNTLNSIVRAGQHGIWIYRELHCGTTNLFDLNFR